MAISLGKRKKKRIAWLFVARWERFQTIALPEYHCVIFVWVYFDLMPFSFIYPRLRRSEVILSYVGAVSGFRRSICVCVCVMGELLKENRTITIIMITFNYCRLKLKLLLGDSCWLSWQSCAPCTCFLLRNQNENRDVLAQWCVL